MKLRKAFTNSMLNLLAVLDNLAEGTNELSLIYKDACHAARKEQQLKVMSKFNKLAGSSDLSDAEIAKVRSAV